MFTLRQRIFVIISIGIAIILAVVLGLIYYRKWLNRQVEAPQPRGPMAPVTGVAPSFDAAKPPVAPIVGKQTIPSSAPANPEEIYLRQLATIFVERFMSYSNQNDNKHIEDTLALSTESMQKWMKTQAQAASLNYAGITTEVMSAAIKTKTASKAVVLIGVQQVVDENGAAKTVQKKGEVSLEKVQVEWKVSGLYWSS